jgi:hypothetical protein
LHFRHNSDAVLDQKEHRQYTYDQRDVVCTLGTTAMQSWTEI